MSIKKFDREEVLKLLKDRCKEAILDYDLKGADLSYANLSGVNLNNADLKGTNLCVANLNGADLRNTKLNGADLRSADLRGANLDGADLRGANLDYSCYPLSCGSLHLKADKRLACQLAYHLCSLQCDDADYIKMRNSILDFANQFHRVCECGKLEEREI